MIQLTILKISGYGPWTLTLGSDREHELQMLQASLYGRLQGLFSERDCLVFPNRADEFFAVSNGLDLQGHMQIQESLKESFDVRLAVSVGFGGTPFEANLNAHRDRRDGKLLSKEHNICGSVCESPDLSTTIMHLDVDDLTSRGRTDSPYEISSAIFALYSDMSNYFMERGSLAFFMGGDNFMVVSSAEAKRSVHDYIARAADGGVSLNCGIGSAGTGRAAAKMATKSLDTIRQIRDSKKGTPPPQVYELSC